MSSVFYTNGPREVWTSEEGSMAQETAKTRWPKIVQGMVDDVQTTINEASSSPSADWVKQGRDICCALSKLKCDIANDNHITPLDPDASPQSGEYNAKLGSFGEVTWHNCPWLFTECYLYRRVQDILTKHTEWQHYDVFARQKLASFVASHDAVSELSSRYMSLYRSGTLIDDDPQVAFSLFVEMTEISLWGNAIDLSLLHQLDPSQIKSLQGAEAIQTSRSRIVSNDSGRVWEYITTHRGGRMDIVLDNAGFEFFTDLVYCLYLIDTGLASEVRLHVKSIPWFVSDVTPRDVDVLLSTLSQQKQKRSGQAECEEEEGGNIRALSERVKRCFRDKVFSVHEHPFWTTGLDFQEMPDAAPTLYESLRESSLVIFKGDLNYRKLVRDAAWPHTTPFEEAIGKLGPVAGRGVPGQVLLPGMKILALRTNKADVCVGLTEDMLARVEEEAPGKTWVRNGRYAVVSFSTGL